MQVALYPNAGLILEHANPEGINDSHRTLSENWIRFFR